MPYASQLALLFGMLLISLNAGVAPPSVDTFVTVESTGAEVHTVTYDPAANLANNVSVLMLHGAAFSAQTWMDIDMPKMLTDAGLKVTLVDIPGFGSSPRFTGNTTLLRQSLVRDLFPANVSKQGILVSPSMSGSYSLPYLAQYASDLGSWVPVAPVGLSQLNTISQEDAEKLRVHAIYGELDSAIVDLALLESKFTNYTQTIIPEGTHPAYLTDPRLFADKIIEEAALIARTASTE